MPMGFETARHLALRTGFGGTAAELAALAELELDAAVTALLDGVRSEPIVPMPGWTDEAPVLSRRERRRLGRMFRRANRQHRLELKGWWYEEMLETPSPLTERLTLMWHNHFTSDTRKVRAHELMARQNGLLRRHALGNFGRLLHDIAEDPAMLRYLDTARSDRDEPNENFARELLELFALGEGHYTEEDIREAARAFTGWRLNRETGEFRFARRQHDGGLKTFMGRTGRFDGHDIIDIVLDQPRTAVHITERVWRELISETPDATEVARLADGFRASGYELRALVEPLLLSPAFLAAENRANLVKSPVELLVGMARSLAFVVDYPDDMARQGRQLGQDVFDPPNVRGWPGGSSWITTNTLMLRQRVSRLAMRREEVVYRLARGGLADWFDGAPGTGGTDRAAHVLLARAPVYAPPASDGSAAQEGAALEALLLDPVFQLK
jgi:uncharacterized protein (DUF1800 family)